MKINTRFSHSSGFSFLELMIVIMMIAILATVAIMAFRPNAMAYKSDDTALQVTRFMREATSLSSAQRRRMRVKINSSLRTISLYNEEGSVSPTDDVLVRQEVLSPSTEVSFSQPATVALPAAPYDYVAAVYTSNIWKGYFQGDGTITDSANAPLSATFFFTPVGATSTSGNNGQIRAVTIFGPSGSIRVWKFRSGPFRLELINETI